MNLRKRMAAAMFKREGEAINAAYAEEWPKENKEGDEMSKSEKLAAFLKTYEYFIDNGTESGAAMRAFREYRFAPDDPPPRPKMPECVRRLVDCLFLRGICDAARVASYARDVEAHYAQSLRLEVGKVYEDASGDRVRILWEWPDRGDGYSFLGAYLRHRWCCEWNAAGIVDGPIGKNLIREVSNG